MNDFDLVFVGDSLTFGWFYQGREQWLEMREKYKVANYNGAINLCGGTPIEMLHYIRWFGTPKTKAYFVMCGANDICGRIDPIPGLKALVKYLSETGAKVFVSTITWRYKLNNLVKKANEEIRKFPELFENTYLVDMYPSYVRRRDLKVRDKVHYNEKGFSVWMNHLNKSVFPLLEDVNGTKRSNLQTDRRQVYAGPGQFGVVQEAV
jgi:lysophospholipase L1-like esterase